MSTAPHDVWVPTETFATRLLLIRRELKMTVKEAATICGIHYATWSTWENGARPSDLAGVITAISESLGVDRDWLMWGKTETAPTDDGGGGGVVRHEGFEPPTRWYEGFDSALHVVDLGMTAVDVAA